SKSSGDGGFSLVAESDLPLLHDLNSPDGRRQLGISDSREDDFEGVHVFPFRLRAGEDASCLNLYQPTRPRILGVSRALIERGGFRFEQSLAQTAEEKQTPWRLLDQTLPQGAIPAVGDANTVQWILELSLGGQLSVTSEAGQEIPLVIVGLMDQS